MAIKVTAFVSSLFIVFHVVGEMKMSAETWPGQFQVQFEYSLHVFQSTVFLFVK